MPILKTYLVSDSYDCIPNYLRINQKILNHGDRQKIYMLLIWLPRFDIPVN